MSEEASLRRKQRQEQSSHEWPHRKWVNDRLREYYSWLVACAKRLRERVLEMAIEAHLQKGGCGRSSRQRHILSSRRFNPPFSRQKLSLFGDDRKEGRYTIAVRAQTSQSVQYPVATLANGRWDKGICPSSGSIEAPRLT